MFQDVLNIPLLSCQLPIYDLDTLGTNGSYDGDWVNGDMHGYGTYKFADGMTYKGIMRDNWPCGEGTAYYPNGGMYVGRWKDGKYEVRTLLAAARLRRASAMPFTRVSRHLRSLRSTTYKTRRVHFTVLLVRANKTSC